MDDICRLCCSVNFVNNHIFDEENALYLKMSLYLPIKVLKNDRLPQKICDKCSCKVNDFYQFCNVAIEVQSRLRSILHSSDVSIDETIDLSLVKSSASPPPITTDKLCDQSTQTNDPDVPNESVNVSQSVQVKEEPLLNVSPVKKEEDNNDIDLDSDHFDHKSSDSEDISLISLKSRKQKKASINGEVNSKRGRKRKTDFQAWEAFMDSSPEGSLTVVEKDSIPELQVEAVKVDDQATNLNSINSDVDVYHCCICMAQCYSRNELLQHYRKHVSELAATKPPPAPPLPEADPPRCTRCRQVVKAADWPRHWQRHWKRDRRPLRCSLCDKAFRVAHQIIKHGLTHTYGEGAATELVDKRFIICDLCPEAFRFMRYLMAHRTQAHPESAGRALTLRCGQCSRSFAHINSLRRHLHAHSGKRKRNFLCNVCGKVLSSRQHLKLHIGIHTGYKPHACKTCGKAFVKKCNLVLHERIHSGEKPNVCSHCGKGFSQRSTLVIHERYHSGARPYVCNLCGRGFVAKGLLSMHLKTTCI